ncbi:MAG: synthase subunit [Glaciihabitans sp.]|nr:synthase subunit [Glaciihabitans sp.]
MTNVIAAEAFSPWLPAGPDLLWGAVIFVVLAVVFVWKILPGILKMLDTTGEKIQADISVAEVAQADAAAALAEFNHKLAEARAEATRIRAQAVVDGEAILANLKVQAGVEAERITAAAAATIEAERHAAIVSLRAEVGLLAIDLASNVIVTSLDDDTKSTAMVDRFLAELESSEQR